MQKLIHTLCIAILSMVTLPLYAADANKNTALQTVDLTANILGGTEAPGLEYPWMASLQIGSRRTTEHHCGATLIADTWVLTAAHCMFWDTGLLDDPENITIVLGSTDLESPDIITRNVSNIYVHPDYIPKGLSTAEVYVAHNDIAILELSEPVDLEPIALPNTSSVPLYGEMATATGWGDQDLDGNNPTVLLELDVPVVSYSSCFAWYHLWDMILDESLEFCAGGDLRGGRDVCYGDSGGPVFVERDGQYVQAGITSGGLGCGYEGTPSMFTRVSTYFDWISSYLTPAPIYDGDSENVVVTVEDLPIVLKPNTKITSSLVAGGTKSYFAQGIDFASLESLSGDADIYVFNSASYSDESLVCFSYELDGLDECQLDKVDDYWIFLITFEASDYSLTVTGEVEEVEEVTIATLSLDQPVEGNVLEETGDVYRATTGSEALLTSVSGDADLLIYSSETFNAVTLLCSSTQAGSAVDSCLYTIDDTEIFILVNGKETADYSLTIIDSASVPEEDVVIDETEEGTSDEIASDIVLSSGGGGSFSGIFALLAFLTGTTLRRRAYRQAR